MRQPCAVLMDRQNAPDPPMESYVQHTAPAASTVVENGTVAKFSLSAPPEHYGAPFIPLNMLLDFAIQHSFHELTVLSELLPKKKEGERKISVAQFAHSTRCVFLKMLALVKWLRQTRKLDVSNSINFYLDNIAFEFVESADILAHVRDELSNARFPQFQIAHSVDSLSLGTCIRIPQCIRKQFIPDMTLKQKRQAQTLSRINQLIQHKLIGESLHLPSGFNQVEIKNGTVVFSAKNEFNATLTLKGQSFATYHWVLLHIDILVNDYDVGLGDSLVHPLQVNLLHQICETKMQDNDRPLIVLYNILHDFCLKLQLDVLNCQALYVSRTISPRFLTIDTYDPRKGILHLSYWSQRKTQQRQKRLQQDEYRITIGRNTNTSCSKLELRHSPPTRPLPGLFNENDEMTTIHRLVSETVLLRCRERLDLIFNTLNSLIPENYKLTQKVQMVGTAAVRLVFNFLPVLDASAHECLHIAMSIFTGDLHCFVPMLKEETKVGRREHKQLVELENLETLLQVGYNKTFDTKSIKKVIQKLQVKLLLKRFTAAVPYLHFRHIYPFFTNNMFKDVKTVSIDRICLQFLTETTYYLVIAFGESADTFNVVPKIFLANTNGSRISVVDVLNNYSILPEFSKRIDIFDRNLYDLAQLLFDSSIDFTSRNGLAETLHRMAERFMFIRIQDYLTKLKVGTKMLDCDNLTGYELHLTNFSDLKIKDNRDYFEDIYNCVIRLNLTRSISTALDLGIANPPVSPAIFPWNTNAVIRNKQGRKVFVPYLQYLPTVSPITPMITHAVALNTVDRLKICSVLYDPLKMFTAGVAVSKYVSILEYNHHRVVLAYGSSHHYIVSIYYRPKTHSFGLTFQKSHSYDNHLNIVMLNKGSDRENNPHYLVTSQLQEEFNKSRSLIELTMYLINTTQIMSILQDLKFKRPHYSSEFGEKFEEISERERKKIASNLKMTVNFITSTRARIQLGICHLDLLLLKKNSVAIEGCLVLDRRSVALSTDYMPDFVEFFKNWGKEKVMVFKEGDSAIEEQRIFSPAAYSPASHPNGPPSVPSRTENHLQTPHRPNSALAQYKPHSPANGVSNKNTNGNGNVNTPSTSNAQPRPQMQRNKKMIPSKTFPIIIVQLDEFRRIFTQRSLLEPSPIEQYMYAVNIAHACKIPYKEYEDFNHAIKGLPIIDRRHHAMEKEKEVKKEADVTLD